MANRKAVLNVSNKITGILNVINVINNTYIINNA